VLAVGTAVFTAATSRAAPTLLTLRRGEVTDAVHTREVHDPSTRRTRRAGRFANGPGTC
jgi:hypothetical protein